MALRRPAVHLLSQIAADRRRVTGLVHNTRGVGGPPAPRRPAPTILPTIHTYTTQKATLKRNCYSPIYQDLILISCDLYTLLKMHSKSKLIESDIACLLFV